METGKSIPIEAECSEIVKTDCKMYAYILQVKWKNGHHSTIRRKYSDVHDFRIQMKKEDKALNIPGLPSHRWLSNVLGSHDKRKKQVSDFFKAVLKSTAESEGSETVLQFFMPTHEDNQIPQSLASQEASVKARLSFVDRKVPANSSNVAAEAAKKAQKLRKISEPARPPGYVPERHAASDHIIEQFILNTDYEPEGSNVKLKRAQIVELLEKDEGGWWFVFCENETNPNEDFEGWVPAAFLEPIEDELAPLPPKKFWDAPEEFSNQPIYEVITEYNSAKSDELNCQKGEKVKVLHKGKDGWWKVTLKEKTGFVPALNLAEKRLQDQVGNKAVPLQSIYKKKPPPRRKISDREVRELYAEVLPRRMRKEKPKTPFLNYAEVDFSDDVRPISVSVVQPSVIYTEVNPVALPPREQKDDDDDDGGDDESDHIYKNVEHDARSRNYENTEIINRKVLEVKSTSENRFYEVCTEPKGKLAHSSPLVASVGTIIYSTEEKGELVYGVICSLATACKTPPAIREGWINKKHLQSVAVEVVNQSGPRGVPVIRPKPQPRSKGIQPPKKKKTPKDEQAVNPPPVPSRIVDQKTDRSSESNGHKDTPDAPWCAGVLTREECQEIMSSARDGEFLLRQSPHTDQWTLSVKWRAEIKHFKISVSTSNLYRIGKVEFPTLGEIVEHYQRSELFVTDQGLKVSLANPCKFQRPDTVC